MSYKITPNFFSLKYFGDGYDHPVRIHKITYNKCNFRCDYCDFANRNPQGYRDYSEAQFESVVRHLTELGKYFKFTGGEPTINPDIERDLRIVKKYSGHVFLDTNGSMPQITKKLIEQGLVDVLGISLKGIEKSEAATTANIKNSRLCWDNVFQTLDFAQELEINTIVTMVFYNGIPLDNLTSFSKALLKYPSVRMKINNLIPCDHQGKGTYTALPQAEIEEAAKSFVENNPVWKNRVTLVSTPDAMKDNDKVIVL